MINSHSSCSRSKAKIHPSFSMEFALCSCSTIFFSASQTENLEQSFRTWPFSLQKKHFTFDMSDVPSFVLSLLFPLSFSLSLSLSFSLFLSLSLSLPLPERVDFHWCDVVPVRYVPWSVRLISLSTHCWEYRISAVSSRSDQCASVILDLVGCVSVLLLWSCLNSVSPTVVQVVPTPPRSDLCLPQTETAGTASASLGTVLCVSVPTLPENVSRFRIHSLDRSVSWSSGVHDLSCTLSAWTQAVSLVSSETRSYRSNF